MNCPRGCPTPLEAVTERGIELDRCESCKGLWFDNGEAEVVTRPDGIPQEVIDRVAALGQHVNDDTSPDLPCPRCGKLMARERYAKSGVQIDRCGCGLWFDDGELERLQAYRQQTIIEVRKAHGDDYPPELYEQAMSRFFFDLGTPPS